MMASRLKIWEVNCVPCHCTRMYPMALMCLFPLSGEYVASFPHVLESSCRPPVPKPMRESQEPQLFSWLAVMPILALDRRGLSPTALNPSLLQYDCREACDQSATSTCYDPVRWRGISQREQRVGALVNQNKPELMTSLHIEADLGERCIPVGW